MAKYSFEEVVARKIDLTKIEPGDVLIDSPLFPGLSDEVVQWEVLEVSSDRKFKLRGRWHRIWFADRTFGDLT